MYKFSNNNSLIKELLMVLKQPISLLTLSCTFCAILMIWAWYPGVIHDDAMAQYLQATGIDPVTDWHPPLMVRFWQAEIFLFHTPNLLNATYILIFSIGVFLLLSAHATNKSWWICLLIFIFPICLMSNGDIYKDVILANLVLLVSGLLIASFAHYGKISPSKKYLSLLILTIAAFLRFNAIFIIAPIMILLLFNWKPTFTRLVGCLGIVFVFCAVTPIVNHSLLRSTKDYAVTSLQVFDLGGIAWQKLKHPNQETIFHTWQTSNTEEKLAACYSPRGWDGYGVWEPSSSSYLKASFDTRSESIENAVLNNITKETTECRNLGNQVRKDPKQLNKLWLHEIKQHPFLWLKHRYAHFHTILGTFGKKSAHMHILGLDAPGLYNLDWIHTKEIHSFPGDWLAKTTKVLVRAPAHLLQCASLWLAASVFLFIATLICRTQQQKIINCLSFSSITYISGYLFIGVGGLLRYLTPAIYIIIAATVCIFSFKERLSDRRHTIMAAMASLLVLSLSFF